MLRTEGLGLAQRNRSQSRGLESMGGRVRSTCPVDLVSSHSTLRALFPYFRTLGKDELTPNVAPPFARHGLPKKPSRKRSVNRPPKLSTKAVGIVRMMKIAKLLMYGRFLPNCGTAIKVSIHPLMSGCRVFERIYREISLTFTHRRPKHRSASIPCFPCQHSTYFLSK